MWLALLLVLSMLARRLGAWDGSDGERVGDHWDATFGMFRCAARSAISPTRSSTTCECTEGERDGKSGIASARIAFSSGDACAERIPPRFFSAETAWSIAASTSAASYAIAGGRAAPPPRRVCPRQIRVAAAMQRRVNFVKTLFTAAHEPASRPFALDGASGTPAVRGASSRRRRSRSRWRRGLGRTPAAKRVRPPAAGA
jgi:hypothetical protein